MVNAASNCFTALREEVEKIPSFCCKEPDKISAALDGAMQHLQENLTQIPRPIGLSYQNSLEEFSRITRKALIDITETPIPIMIKECFEKMCPGISVDEDEEVGGLDNNRQDFQSSAARPPQVATRPHANSHIDQVTEKQKCPTAASCTSSPRDETQTGLNPPCLPDFFQGLDTAVNDLEPFGVNVQPMKERIAFIRRVCLREPKLTTIFLVRLVGNLSNHLSTSPCPINILDTPIPALVKKTLYPLQEKRDEKQTLEGLIQYLKLITPAYQEIWNSKDPNSLINAILNSITKEVAACIQNLKNFLEPCSKPSQNSSSDKSQSSSSTVSRIPNSNVAPLEGTALQASPPLQKLSNDKERFDELWKLLELIDGDTAILCAGLQTPATDIVRHHVGACLELLQQAGIQSFGYR